MLVSVNDVTGMSARDVSCSVIVLTFVEWQVRGEDWHLRRRTGKEMEQLEMEELVNNGEWYFKIDLPVVERDYNTQLQESIVKVSCFV